MPRAILLIAALLLAPAATLAASEERSPEAEILTEGFLYAHPDLKHRLAGMQDAGIGAGKQGAVVAEHGGDAGGPDLVHAQHAAEHVDIQLGHLRRRLAERRIELEVTDAAEKALASEGFDPAFGARPLKRVIQREIGDRLALLVLEGKVADGATVTVDTDADGQLTISA